MSFTCVLHFLCNSKKYTEHEAATKKKKKKKSVNINCFFLMPPKQDRNLLPVDLYCLYDIDRKEILQMIDNSHIVL